MHETTRSGLPTWVGSALVLIAAVAATGVIWVLVDQNRALKETLAASTGNSRPPAGLEVGDILPNLQLESIAGESQNLYALAGDGVAVIGLMTTTCPYCEANLARWAVLDSSLRDAGIPFASISFSDVDDVRAYRQQHGIDWAIWASRPGALGRPFLVPTTVVLGPAGAVITSATGVLNPSEVAQLAEQAISTSRPIPQGAER